MHIQYTTLRFHKVRDVLWDHKREYTHPVEPVSTPCTNRHCLPTPEGEILQLYTRLGHACGYYLKTIPFIEAFIEGSKPINNHIFQRAV